MNNLPPKKQMLFLLTFQLWSHLQVRTKKSNFGFIACCQRSGQLFFHSSALQDCEFEDLKKGDDVEFSVERHPERGTMAVR